MDIRSQTAEMVVLQGTYEETNFEDPVIRFYVSLSDMTATATPDETSSFSVMFSYDGLELDTAYPVYVIAENAIGNGTSQSPLMFTVPGSQEHFLMYICASTNPVTVFWNIIAVSELHVRVCVT